MKLLGHVYIATNSFPHLDKALLALGALIPETVFYTKNPALTFDQIHEGGLELYKYCQKNYPEICDLAIGNMTHSVKYGADSFNTLASLVPLGYDESDIPKIADALGLNMEIAEARAHNLYDLILDYHINLQYPDLKNIVEDTKTLDKRNVSKVLADCFQVSQDDVYQNLIHLWDKFDLRNLETFEGLAMFWKILASDLKEKDPVDIDKTARLLKYFYYKAKPAADGFLDEVVESTRTKIGAALENVAKHKS